MTNLALRYFSILLLFPTFLFTQSKVDSTSKFSLQIIENTDYLDTNYVFELKNLSSFKLLIAPTGMGENKIIITSPTGKRDVQSASCYPLIEVLPDSSYVIAIEGPILRFYIHYSMRSLEKGFYKMVWELNGTCSNEVKFYHVPVKKWRKD